MGIRFVSLRDGFQPWRRPADADLPPGEHLGAELPASHVRDLAPLPGRLERGLGCPAESQPTSDKAAADCLDFCDALAYWAGKRLCGRVGGAAKWGLVDVADVSTTAEKESLSQLAGTTAMELIYACTQGGTTLYPCGNEYDADRCTDGSLDVTDMSNKTCHGIEPPFNQIYDVTASVGEWQNLCTMSPGLGCLSGGGGKGDDEKAQMCSAQVGFAYGRAVAPRQGFRCCADGVPISDAQP